MQTGAIPRADFERTLARNVAMGSTIGLRRLLFSAEKNVAQAQHMGWTALAQSWQIDVRRLETLLNAMPMQVRKRRIEQREAV